MVNLGTVLGLSALGLIFFFREDIGASLSGLKGFGKDFGKLPDININVPDIGNPFEGVPEAFAEAGAGLGQAGADIQKSIAEGIASTQAGIDTSIQQAQQNFDQNIKGISEGAGIAGADIQETFTGNRNAIGDFFGNLFGGGSTSQVEAQDGAPITTPTVTTPATIDRQAGRRTFGGQTQPKMTLTKEQASTPQESNVIISEQPNLSLVSPFLTTQQKTEELGTTSRFSGTGSRR